MLRRFTKFTLLAAFSTLLLLPAVANAQYRDRDYDDDPYYSGRDNGRQRGRDRRNNDRYDDRYNGADLREAVRRIEERSDNFRDVFDRALDRSRYDGTNREDRIAEVAHQFEESADRLSKRFGNGRNLDNTRDDARRLLDSGARLDNFVNRNRLDSRTASLWSGIRQDLRIVANAYGYRLNDVYDNGNRYPSNNRNQRRGSRDNNWGNVLGDIFGGRRN